ncbi:MAG: hypothetical protein NC245_01410 [Muribaculum sp.]|nr:hypothetical protein [Muribaculum sp.]
MNIAVINGTEKHGVTYQLKEIFLAAFKDTADITEYDLPRDCPHFCIHKSAHKNQVFRLPSDAANTTQKRSRISRWEVLGGAGLAWQSQTVEMLICVACGNGQFFIQWG